LELGLTALDFRGTSSLQTPAPLVSSLGRAFTFFYRLNPAAPLETAAYVMSSSLQTRLIFSAGIAFLLSGPLHAHGFGPRQRAIQRAEARSQMRVPQMPPPASRPPAIGPGAIPQREGHLPKWIENHKNLSPAEQHRALQNEPGFRELDPATQQRELNQLDRLNSMTPQERNRTLNGVEGLERLSPQQQQQWDRAVHQLDGVEPQRRRVMIHAIEDLRQMPANQRQQIIDSPAFAGQFSPEERQIMGTVLTAL
jgi:hypothetical protein